MTFEAFYGDYFERMQKTEKRLLTLVSEYASVKREKEGIKPIVYFCSRIKTPESMLKKLETLGQRLNINLNINRIFRTIS